MPISGRLLPCRYYLSKSSNTKCVTQASCLFNQTPTLDAYSCSLMLKEHTRDGNYRESVLMYVRMLQNGVAPTKFTYPFLVQACSGMSVINIGEQVHTHAIKFGFDADIYVNNSLIVMYGKCFRVDSARWLFDQMHELDEVSWNSMISGYVFCREIGAARKLFDEMPLRRNVVCWTCLINGYGKEGMLLEMIHLFRQMLLSGDDDVAPNSATMVCLLSACSRLSHFELGRWVVVFIEINRISPNIFLTTALVDMYSKCGNVAEARRIFDEIPNKNLVSWNAMITGYVHRGLSEEAIQLFHLMKVSEVEPDEITMVNMLSACACLGALELGKQFHHDLGRSELELNTIIAAALVDMYSKCGSIDNACLVFTKIKKKDVVVWNSMIMGLALHGHGRESLAVFSDMERQGILPNELTFVGVLCACMHAGLVEEGRGCFEAMQQRYSLSPRLEHYACMVDLLGRAGRLVDAVNLVQNMAMDPDSIIWGALLNACRIHKNEAIANEVGKIILSSEDPNPGCCVLLSNICAAANRWEDVAEVRRLIKQTRIKKPSGCSWIEVDGVVHKFLVDDILHPQWQEIFMMHETLNNVLTGSVCA